MIFNGVLNKYKGTKLTERGVRKILNIIIYKSGQIYKYTAQMLLHSFATVLFNLLV